MDDVAVTLIFGVIGYLMVRFSYPRITMVIALVLGELAERSFHQSLNMSDGAWSIFVTRGVSLALFLFLMACMAIPAIRFLLAKRRLARAAK